MRTMLRPLCVLALVAGICPAQLPTPATRPEATDYAATSAAADVQHFVDTLVSLPHGNRLAVEVAGKTHEGRAQLLVKASLPPVAGERRLRALVIGCIHAGEVEGKEASQMLLREIAAGQHEDLLRCCDVWFLPIYNVDGNEKTGPRNRPGQNGPQETGQRSNAQGLDLNRDFVKADAPETRTLLGLFTRLDPHLFVDLHTTNGSYHGYHLTYSPSLSPNVDPTLTQLTRTLLDGATAALLPQGYRTFDYGNFETRDWEGNGAPESKPGQRGWYTYDHRARYGVNYFGLRNRLAVLGEAYSYDDFETRTAATRAFTLALLQQAAAHREAVLAACAAADARLEQAQQPTWFGFQTGFSPPEFLDVLNCAVERIPGANGLPDRFARTGEVVPERMPVHRVFRARMQRVLPDAWAILTPSPQTVAALELHGIRAEVAGDGATKRCERFTVDQKRKPKRPYQGHQELQLTGRWEAPQPTLLPPGTLLVNARQPLARLAATLLEPESEDSLSTWNFLEATTTDSYPVLRIVGER
jgi:hypothetical protein